MAHTAQIEVKVTFDDALKAILNPNASRDDYHELAATLIAKGNAL